MDWQVSTRIYKETWESLVDRILLQILILGLPSFNLCFQLGYFFAIALFLGFFEVASSSNESVPIF